VLIIHSAIYTGNYFCVKLSAKLSSKVISRQIKIKKKSLNIDINKTWGIDIIFDNFKVASKLLCRF